MPPLNIIILETTLKYVNFEVHKQSLFFKETICMIQVKGMNFIFIEINLEKQSYI